MKIKSIDRRLKYLRSFHRLNIGDVYEDCSYHAVLCTSIDHFYRDVREFELLRLAGWNE